MLLISFFVFLSCSCIVAAKYHHHHQDDVPIFRLHPGLKFCDANPTLKNMNKTRILELEHNEWRAWDLTVLKRVMQMARDFAKGSDYYLSHGWKDENFDAKVFLGNCGNHHKGIVSATDFIFYPLKALLPCPVPIQSIGSKKIGEDGNKLVCDIETQLATDDCVVYSLGSHNNFMFEESILERFKNCKVYTFDCTSSPPKTPIENLHFEKICVGARDEMVGDSQFHRLDTLIEMNKHSSVQFLKVDIEGYEMEVFDAILTPPYSSKLPYQMSFETHHWQRSPAMTLFHHALFQQLTLAGYRPVSRENNVACKSCNEHTFMRVYC